MTIEVAKKKALETKTGTRKPQGGYTQVSGTVFWAYRATECAGEGGCRGVLCAGGEMGGTCVWVTVWGRQGGVFRYVLHVGPGDDLSGEFDWGGPQWESPM